MKPTEWTFLLAMAVLGMSEPVLAVTVPVGAGGNRPSSVAASGTISRGGTITAVEKASGMITVDGIAYRFSTHSVTIHAEAPSSSATPVEVQAGTQIRFNTVKDSAGGRERIVEMWIIRKGDSKLKK